jgi:hypothetical protein
MKSSQVKQRKYRQTSENIFSPVSITYLMYPPCCPEHVGFVLEMIILPSPSLFVSDSKKSANAWKLDRVLLSSPSSSAKLFSKLATLAPYPLIWQAKYIYLEN